MSNAERGPLLETYVLHELRACLDRRGSGGQLAYWRTPSGAEVDFVWTRGSRAIGIEVKATTRWRQEDGAALEQMLQAKQLTRGVAVYRGERTLRDGSIDVLPVARFLEELEAGGILG